MLESTELSEQALLARLTDQEFTDLASRATTRNFQAGEKIIAAGDPATSISCPQFRHANLLLSPG